MTKTKVVLGVAGVLTLLAGLAMYHPLRLRYLFEQGNYEQYLAEAPRDGSYAAHRMEAAKQIRLRECARVRPQLVQTLQDLEAQGKHGEMIHIGGRCRGDKEIDALLAKPIQEAAKRNAEAKAQKGAELRQAALRDSQRNDARWMCRQFVEKTLKAPSTAKFQNTSDFSVTGLGDGKFEVEGYVDAQNSFGAMLRTHFWCAVRNTGGENWQLIGLTTHP